MQIQLVLAESLMGGQPEGRVWHGDFSPKAHETEKQSVLRHFDATLGAQDVVVLAKTFLGTCQAVSMPSSRVI